MKNKIDNFKKFVKNDKLYMIVDGFYIKEILFFECVPDYTGYAYFLNKKDPMEIFSLYYKEINTDCWENEEDAIKIVIDDLEKELKYYKDRLLKFENVELKNDKKNIAEKLGFEYFKSSYSDVKYINRSGKTTEMILNAIVKLSNEEHICIVAKNILHMRIIYDRLIEYCEKLKIPDYDKNIKIISYGGDDDFLKRETESFKNENIFIDYNCYR